MSSSVNLPLNELEKHLLDPNSDCYVEYLLDLVTALVSDCNYPSASNSRTVQSFLNKFGRVAQLIDAQRTKYADFEPLKVIGQGGFGRVQLVRHRRTRRVYAMKMMNKQHLLDHCQSGYWEERDIMVRASSEWLVACHHAFLDRDNVYLCMEYMPGGDLYYWLEKLDTFDEVQARFYLAETVMALEALHSMRFVHRDLKPDNMLLDARGHLKLADFGSCVQLSEDGFYFCQSPIGTPDYISPEMLNCQSKGGKVGPECDWWTLGVIAYEMLFGEPAFYGQSLVETYSRILSHEQSLSIPSDGDPISSELEDLIRQLLKSASVRLGSLTVALASYTDANDIGKAIEVATNSVKSHPFFKSIVWHQLRSQDPPIQPVVNSEIDTSNINFDDDSIHLDIASSTATSKLPHSGGAFSTRKPPAYFTGNNLSFAGYTFNRDHIYLRNIPRGTDNAIGTPATTEHGRTALAGATQQCHTLQTEISELRASVQQLEKQTAIDQVTLRDAQRRLQESNLELEKSKVSLSELEKSLLETRLRCSTLQAERDRLVEDSTSLTAQVKSGTDLLETERRKAIALDEAKTALDAKVEQLQLELHETRIKLSTQLKQDELMQDASDTPESGQCGLVATMEAKMASLQAENREARQKATLLMTEASNLARNYADQVKELSGQLLEAQNVCRLYQTRAKELEDCVISSTALERTLRTELSSAQAELDMVLSTKRTMEDRLVSADSSLAAIRVELRSAHESAKIAKEQDSAEVIRLRCLAEERLSDLEDVSKQLDEMRLRCMEAEGKTASLGEQVSKLQVERELQQRNMKAIVDKLLHEVEGRMTPAAVRKRAKEHDYAACQQLAKNYKNLQSLSEKEKANMQSTIDRYKVELDERNVFIAALTEEARTKDQELLQLNGLVNQLYARLDQASQMQSTPVKLDRLPGSPASGDSVITMTAQNVSGRMSPPSSRAPTTALRDELFSRCLEQVVDLDGKGRGRKKLLWKPNFAVLKPFVLLFYISQRDRDMGMAPVEEILLCRVVHVRKATAADLIHAQPADLKRTIQFFYQKEEAGDLTHSTESPDFDPNSTIVSVRSTTSSSSASANGSAHSHLRWLGHTFQPMRFRIGTVLCEVCNRPCSELRSPPPALECIKCRMRIHWEHVDQHQKFIPCHNATQIRYIRLPNVAEQQVWLDHMNLLIQTLRELQQNPEKLLESGFSGLASAAGGVHQIGTMSSVQPIYRSLRAGSIGPAVGNVPLRFDLKPPLRQSSRHSTLSREQSPNSLSRSKSPSSSAFIK